MKRVSAPVLFFATAVAISVIALPAIGYVPWQTKGATPAKPAQIQAMVKVDPADAKAAGLEPLRAMAQDTLQSLTDRDTTSAREHLSALQQAWTAQNGEQQRALADRWESLDAAIRKAVAKLSSPGTELFIGKAAVLDVLSAFDAASAPVPAVVASAAK